MTAAAPESQARSISSGEDSIKSSLNILEVLLTEGSRQTCAPELFEDLERELRCLHARLRVHHAADQLTSQQFDELPPELTEDAKRLQNEHPTILGKLDRMIRSVDSMPDRSLEEKEVFFLRGNELVALLRRHQAEEDRLFHLAVWRDTGGES